MTLTQITKVRGPGIHTLANIVSNSVSLGGIATASNFKTGTSNLHSAGVEVAGINVLGADTPIGTGATIYNSGAAVFTGVVTATKFVGQADISGGSIVGTSATFSGNVSIGGTLTYEDVTNIDSVGIITARDGLKVLAGGANVVGVVTASAGIVDSTLTAGRVVYVDSDKSLTDSANLTYSSSVFQITKGTSGGAAANTDAALILDNSSHTYVQFRTPDNKEQGLLFGDDADNDAGGITYVHSSNHLGFRVNADERVRIDSSGRVLLGTDVAPSSANTLLRVHTPISSSSVNSIEISHNTNGADKAGAALGLAIGNGGESTNAADLYFSTATNGSLVQRLKITSDGKYYFTGTGGGSWSRGLGIETESVGAADEGVILNARASGVTGRIKLQTNSKTAMTILGDGGNIGIGTDNPAKKLEVWDATQGVIRIRGGGGGSNSSRKADLSLFASGAREYVVRADASDASFKIVDVTDSNAERLRIDSNGHITPGNAGTQDLGSTSKEFRNLYIGNSGRVYLGDAQEVSLYHDGNNTYLLGGSDAGLMQIKNLGGGDVELFSNDKVRLRVNGGENAVVCNNNNSVDLYYDASTYSTPKLKTSHYGVTVHGEVAASQDYPTIKPTLDLNFAATKTLDTRFEYYRYGPASYVDENGKVVLVGDDVPRFDHDPVTGECKGLLVEGERRNILPYSFDAGKWVAGSAGTLTRDAGIAPDGTMTATKALSSSNDIDLNPKVSGTNGSSGNITVSSSVTYTLSVWAKASTAAQVGNNFKVRMKRVSGTAFAAETTFALTGNWARYSVTGTTPANVTQLMCYVGGVSGSEALVWGAQLESGTTASSLIPTYGYTQLRGADVVQITGEEFTDFYNQEEGTIFLSASYDTDARAAAIVTIDDISAYANYTEVGYRAGGASSGQLSSYIRTTAGNDQYYKNWTSSATQGNEFKIALGYKDDNYASSANGSTVHTDTSGTTHKTYDRLKFSEVHTVGHGGVGHYRRLMYYSKRITNSQLVTLTS